MPRHYGSKNAKTQAWERLGNFMTTKGSKRMLKIMEQMSDEDYANVYLKMAQYFKPKMQASTVQQKGEINVTIASDDKDLIDKV